MLSRVRSLEVAERLHETAEAEPLSSTEPS